jgi:hypothetical protein
MLIFVDVEILEVELTVLKQAPGIAHVGLPEAQGLDLCTFQHKTGFILLKQVVFVTGFTVEDFQWCRC